MYPANQLFVSDDDARTPDGCLEARGRAQGLGETPHAPRLPPQFYGVLGSPCSALPWAGPPCEAQFYGRGSPVAAARLCRGPSTRRPSTKRAVSFSLAGLGSVLAPRRQTERESLPQGCPEPLARAAGTRVAAAQQVQWRTPPTARPRPRRPEDERTTLIHKKRPRRLRRSVVAASVLVLCGTAVKVRPRVQEYRLGSDVGELGEYPTATWEAINNDSVDKVYDLEEHILVTTEVNDAYVFYKELLFGRFGRATGTLDPSRGIVKSHAYATSAWNTFQSNLDDKLMKANSIVWVSVVNTMDTLVAGGMQKELNAMGVADEVIYWGCN